MQRLQWTLLLAVGCSSSAPISPAHEAPSQPEAAAPSTTSPRPPDESKPSGGVTNPAARLPTEEQLRKHKSLDDGATPFPKISEVVKEAGRPSAEGKVVRLQYRFDRRSEGKNHSCSTLDLIALPSGEFASHLSILNDPACRTVKLKSGDVRKALVDLGTTGTGDGEPVDTMLANLSPKPFKEVAAAFEKRLGKPSEQAEVAIAAWRYQDAGGSCKLVAVTTHLGSGAGQAIWALPCEEGWSTRPSPR